MIYLDTHVVVWLYGGLTEKFSDLGLSLINDNDLFISPMVRLELQYLQEIGRITEESNVIVTDLANSIGLRVCDQIFNLVVAKALEINWTRDPFDRLIVAQAAINENILLTKDLKILAHYNQAKWE